MFTVISHGEFFNKDVNKIVSFDKHTFIYIDSTYSFYMMPVVATTFRKTLGKNDQEVVAVDSSYQLSVFKTTEHLGLQYSFKKNEINNLIDRVEIDSVLKTASLDKKNLSYFSLDFGKPFSSNSSDHEKIEKYVPEKKTQGEPDTIFRTYDKRLRNITFSFSPELDKKNKSKLVKTAYLMKKMPKGSLYPDIDVPETISYYEIKLCDFLKPQQIKDIILRFEKDYFSQIVSKNN
jgi:hypothetical protein